MFCELLLLVRERARDDCMLPVQAVEGLSEFPGSRFAHREFVLFEPLPIGSGFRRVGILTAYVRQFGISQARISFNRAQGVGGFDGAMLSRISGENDPSFVLFDVSQEFEHLLAPNLPG